MVGIGILYSVFFYIYLLSSGGQRWLESCAVCVVYCVSSGVFVTCMIWRREEMERVGGEGPGGWALEVK